MNYIDTQKRSEILVDSEKDMLSSIKIAQAKIKLGKKTYDVDEYESSDESDNNYDVLGNIMQISNGVAIIIFKFDNKYFCVGTDNYVLGIKHEKIPLEKFNLLTSSGFYSKISQNI